MEKEHMAIIGLIVILIIMGAVIISLYANMTPANKNIQKQNLTNHTNITKNNNTTVTAEPVTDTSTQDHHEEKTDDNNKQEDTRKADTSQQRSNYEYEDTDVEEGLYSSSSEDSGDYLSSDDYYISDYGFIISTDPQYNR